MPRALGERAALRRGPSLGPEESPARAATLRGSPATGARLGPTFAQRRLRPRGAVESLGNPRPWPRGVRRHARAPPPLQARGSQASPASDDSEPTRATEGGKGGRGALDRPPLSRAGEI